MYECMLWIYPCRHQSQNKKYVYALSYIARGTKEKRYTGGLWYLCNNAGHCKITVRLFDSSQLCCQCKQNIYRNICREIKRRKKREKRKIVYTEEKTKKRILRLGKQGREIKRGEKKMPKKRYLWRNQKRKKRSETSTYFFWVLFFSCIFFLLHLLTGQGTLSSFLRLHPFLSPPYSLITHANQRLLTLLYLLDSQIPVANVATPIIDGTAQFETGVAPSYG
ncbi:hypothetical protein BX661DRAFT_59618 [Kickxella alabastrina]|uniref:uncharacterized protein n=1 Tax=Kickxella alabastrina TaxID=61397 RepID=UPI00221E9F55|nr:uncharacterized protein BX661DRAFT_59618 [Kickxella alabastrina]KAI7822491.1 hypothetical protein BX661DRAFT_59618 [Kickxella alabastrina]